MSSSKQIIANAETMTCNLEAEQALLGALLLNNAALENVSDYLRAEHFSDKIHGRIFDAIQKLIDRGQVVDPITLKDFFDKDKTIEPLGGSKYLVDLVDSVISIISVSDYARLIYDLFLRRQLIQIGHEIVQEARQFDLNIPAIQYIENAEKKLYDLATKGQFSNPIIGFSEGFSKTMDSIEADCESYREQKPIGISTELIDLDKIIGGFRDSSLYILAASPGMGKTALITNIAYNAAKKHIPVLFFSQEMSFVELHKRMISSEWNLNSKLISEGKLEKHEINLIKQTSTDIPFYIDDTGALEISVLCARARRQQKKNNIQLIVVDYLQLSRSKDQGNRVNEVSEISRALKALAKNLDVPVVALSQLSRDGVKQNDKPKLHHLRDSGSIEQDADVVMFIYEEGKSVNEDKAPPYKTDRTSSTGKTYIIVAKNRHGETGEVQVYFDKTTTTFRNAQK